MENGDNDGEDDDDGEDEEYIEVENLRLVDNADKEIIEIAFGDSFSFEGGELTDEIIEAAARQMAASALENACRAFIQISGRSPNMSFTDSDAVSDDDSDGVGDQHQQDAGVNENIVVADTNSDDQ